MADAATVSSSPSSTTPAEHSPYLRTVFYFGNASPVNFWSSDLSHAAADFQRIKRDGFNAVALAVPWGEFQPRVSPPSYNPDAFRRLHTLATLAQRLHLQVVLRLSYTYDTDPGDTSPNRFSTVFTDPTVYQAWLDYISRVRQTVATLPNVRIGELSWEDFWSPVQAAESATTPAQQLALATSTGFRSWLEQNYSLSEVSSQYGTPFAAWTSVPTPLPTQAAFGLMFAYDDWAVVHRFFEPAAVRFPGLNLESRVDIDPIHQGTQVIGGYSHASTFQLPGATYTGLYFSPYMGDPSTALTETATEGLTGLRSVLSNMQSRSGGRPLFVFEYETESNSPQVSNDPSLPSDQLPQFIEGSAPILRQYTSGYAMWTYRDYNLSPLFNPSFALGTAGWSVHGRARRNSSTGGTGLSLSHKSSVSQTMAAGYLTSGPVIVDLNARSTGRSGAKVEVGLGGAPLRSFVVHGGSHRYQVDVPVAAVTLGKTPDRLTITTTAPVSITNIQVHDFTQLGDIYSVDGRPEIGAAALRSLNRQLAAPSTLQPGS